MSTYEINAQIDALCLAFSDMRKALGLKPESFPTAYDRVTEGSDGTGYQNTYVRCLEHLIGTESE